MSTLKIVKSLPIAELFSLMPNNESHTTMTQRAYNVFVERYENDLKEICKEVCRKNNFNKIKDLDKDVFNRSIEEFYINSKSFLKSNKKISTKNLEKLIFRRFGEIAEKTMNEIILENNKFELKHLIVPDYHNHLEDLKSFQKDEEQIAEEEKAKDIKELLQVQNLFVFQKALKRLKPREREIIIVYYQAKQGNNHLSDDRIAYLCKKWKVTVDNLQHIKPRIVKKLNKLYRDEQTKAQFGSDTTNAGRA
jgi:hypothetical protein